jgi:hypothetical protein
MIYVVLNVLSVELQNVFEAKKNKTMSKDLELQIANCIY